MTAIPVPRRGDATAVVVNASPGPNYVAPTMALDRLAEEQDAKVARRRILDRVPSRLRVRARLLEAKLDRERFVNTGLRARLAELVDQREDLVECVAQAIDDEARVLGHAHPVIVRVRAILATAAAS